MARNLLQSDEAYSTMVTKLVSTLVTKLTQIMDKDQEWAKRVLKIQKVLKRMEPESQPRVNFSSVIDPLCKLLK